MEREEKRLGTGREKAVDFPVYGSTFAMAIRQNPVPALRAVPLRLPSHRRAKTLQALAHNVFSLD